MEGEGDGEGLVVPYLFYSFLVSILISKLSLCLFPLTELACTLTCFLEAD